MSFATAFHWLLPLLGSFFLGGLGTALFYRFKVGELNQVAATIIQNAEAQAEALKNTTHLELQEKKFAQQQDLERLRQKDRKKLRLLEERLKEREDKLEARMYLVEKKLSDIEKREAILIRKHATLEEEKEVVREKKEALLQQFESLTTMSREETQQAFLDKIKDQVQADAAKLTVRIKEEAQENAEQEATRIICTAINRLAARCVSTNSLCVVDLPHEEMKGRIIGREGRNIRALEKATGVTFVIDDTPKAVLISGFDPVRKHIAKEALQELILDGRIHPTRIEESVVHATDSVQKQIRQAGEEAALLAGAINFHPELILLLGKLKFRYSYGQNVLEHSIEVSRLMGLMASELKLNASLAKRIGLLHDIGKAVSHEIEGSHAVIGHDFALRYGESPEVAKGIGCHHQEMAPTTIEGSLCSAADALSGGRTGARTEAVEQYIKRLARLEEIAMGFTGVESAYALQAGREVRVAVLPDEVDDVGVVNLARDLSKAIEQELNYPGKIKVTVVREKRAIEYAV